MQVSSFWAGVLQIFGLAIFGLLCFIPCTRVLLEKHPKFFSFGFISKEGPSKETADNTNFTLTLVGRGWDRKVGVDYKGKPKKEVKVTVFGRNIAYGATSDCLVESALTCLEESDKMPGNGGVIPPGFAFGRTTLVQRLHEHGVTFDAEVKQL